jgi:hypothetical protein
VIFEYKVRARHRLGWKEFSFYATTEIEEFLNRNSIEYVRNATDIVEHRLFNEIERLNNIINEFEKWLDKKEKLTFNSWNKGIHEVQRKLQELKGSE